MFIIDLTYKKPLTEVDKHRSAHIEFLTKYYNAGKFITSGAKKSRVGGVILAQHCTAEEVQEIITHDPFYVNAIADYTITEFATSKYCEGFASCADEDTK